jgi:hypothetical protein
MEINNLNIEIKKLTVSHKRSLNVLANQFKQNINIINRYILSVSVKINLITNITKKYNNNIKRLTNQYNIKKNKLIQLMSTSNTNTNKKALLIGINYINTKHQLYGCINDTNNIKKLLQNNFNYNIFNILTDNTKKKPNRLNIINELTNLLVNTNNGDSIFFLYSGHGTFTVDLNNDESDGQDEMIVPLGSTDISTCILDDEINEIIHKNLKVGVNLFMMFDSCFSGTVVDLKYNYLTSISDTNEYETNLLTINSTAQDTPSQVIMISGCKDNQTSADAYVNYFNTNIYSGAMTFSFLQTIQDLGLNISLKTLIENMRKILKENGYSQIPQLSSGTQIDISNTILSL